MLLLSDKRRGICVNDNLTTFIASIKCEHDALDRVLSYLDFDKEHPELSLYAASLVAYSVGHFNPLLVFGEFKNEGRLFALNYYGNCDLSNLSAFVEKAKVCISEYYNFVYNNTKMIASDLWDACFLIRTSLEECGRGTTTKYSIVMDDSSISLSHGVGDYAELRGMDDVMQKTGYDKLLQIRVGGFESQTWLVKKCSGDISDTMLKNIYNIQKSYWGYAHNKTTVKSHPDYKAIPQYGDFNGFGAFAISISGDDNSKVVCKASIDIGDDYFASIVSPDSVDFSEDEFWGALDKRKREAFVNKGVYPKYALYAPEIAKSIISEYDGIMIDHIIVFYMSKVVHQDPISFSGSKRTVFKGISKSFGDLRCIWESLHKNRIFTFTTDDYSKESKSFSRVNRPMTKDTYTASLIIYDEG